MAWLWGRSTHLFSPPYFLPLRPDGPARPWNRDYYYGFRSAVPAVLLVLEAAAIPYTYNTNTCCCRIRCRVCVDCRREAVKNKRRAASRSESVSPPSNSAADLFSHRRAMETTKIVKVTILLCVQVNFSANISVKTGKCCTSTLPWANRTTDAIRHARQGSTVSALRQLRTAVFVVVYPNPYA